MKEKLLSRRIRLWLFPVLGLLGLLLLYYGNSVLVGERMRWDLTIPADALVPFWPWTIVVYAAAYVFWGVSWFLFALLPLGRSLRYYVALYLAYAVCLVLFVAFPTTYVRPEVTGTGLWPGLVRLLYQIDRPYNLFPSLHCLLSWLSWAGVRSSREVPLWYKTIAFLLAAAICLSTVTVKQHVLVDILGGVLLAELLWAVSPLVSRPLHRRLGGTGEDAPA